MHHSFQLKYLCWTGKGRWRAVVVGRDPVGDGRGDSAVVSPTDDKVVLVGEGRIACGNFVGTEWWTT